MNKPISPSVHALVDYGLTASNLLLPTLLGMSTKARALFAGFGAVQGAVNALTDQPYAVKEVLPLETHRVIDISSTPLFAAAPALLGLAKEPKARAYWIAGTLALVALYALTDWNAEPKR